MSKPNRFPPLASWMLWRHLLDPPVDPMYERILHTRPSSYPVSAIAWGALIFSLLTCCCLFQFLPYLSGGVIIPLFIVMIAATTYYVAAWVIQISAALAREHNRSTYDLFCVTPLGTLGVTWAICAAYLHSSDALGWIDAARKVVTSMVIFTLAVIALISHSTRAPADPFSTALVILEIALVAGIVYADHVQTVVLGSLIAMLAPTYVRASIDARVLALFVFLALQVIACLPTVLIVLGFGTSDPLFVSLLVLCAVREGVVVALWRLLTMRLNAIPLELAAK